MCTSTGQMNEKNESAAQPRASHSCVATLSVAPWHITTFSVKIYQLVNFRQFSIDIFLFLHQSYGLILTHLEDCAVLYDIKKCYEQPSLYNIKCYVPNML